MIRTLALALFVSTIGVAFVGAQAPAASLADTPQGKVVLAFYKAAHAADLAGVKKVITAESAKDLDGPMGDMIKSSLKDMAPTATPTIAKVNVTGNSAVVNATYKTESTTSTDTWYLAKVGAEWKIDMHHPK